MQSLRSAHPRTELRRYVRAYAQRQVDFTAAFVQPVPPSLEHVIEFDFLAPPEILHGSGVRETAPRVSVVGPQINETTSIVLSGMVDSFAIFLQPFGLWQCFRIPIPQLADDFLDGEALTRVGLSELWHVLAECPSFEERVARTEDFLVDKVTKAAGLTPVMLSAMHQFHRHGMGSIQAFADQSGMSLRHFERRFASEIGFRPKQFARIARFQAALDAKVSSPQRSWLSIAHQFGYQDQTHMIRDFRSICGESPERFFTGLGDARPPALAAEITPAALR